MIWSLVKIGVLVYIGFGAFLYAAQRSLMYLPVPARDSERTQAEYLQHDGVRLKIWRLGEVRPQALIYFGGNAEDVYLNADHFRRALPGHTVYLVNYRGYGGSTGEPSEQGLFADALRVYDHIRERHAGISVVGRSLGSGVAAYLAAQRAVRSVVLVTPFDSVLEVARGLYPVYPISLLLKDQFDSTRYAADVVAPTLLLVAGNDRVIPPRHADALAEAFADGVAIRHVLPDAGHNGLSMLHEYWDVLAAFVRCPHSWQAAG